MSERKERLRRKQAALHFKKLSCADSVCGWWGVSLVNIRCPRCRGRTVTE